MSFAWPPVGTFGRTTVDESAHSFLLNPQHTENEDIQPATLEPPTGPVSTPHTDIPLRSPEWLSQREEKAERLAVRFPVTRVADKTSPRTQKHPPGPPTHHILPLSHGRTAAAGASPTIASWPRGEGTRPPFLFPPANPWSSQEARLT